MPKQTLAERTTDRWLKSRITLKPNEEVLDRGYFSYRVWWWQWTQGRLYLTNDRLIWLRLPLSIPVGPRKVELPLSKVREITKRRAPPVNLQRALCVETTGGGEHWFSPMPVVEDLNGWGEALSKAMKAARKPATNRKPASRRKAGGKRKTT
jgi:hypothetical protein